MNATKKGVDKILDNRTYVLYSSALIFLHGGDVVLIGCLFVKHFPVKVELQRSPNLRGRPILIMQSLGAKRSILDASEEVDGVFSGMSVQEASARCPSGLFLEADLPAYSKAFNDILIALENRSPVVEDCGLGTAYVDLTGLNELYGGEARVITTLISALPEIFTPQVGVAHGKYLAFIAAMMAHPNGAIQLPDDIQKFFQNDSVDLLPIPRDMKIRLHRFGLHTMGQVGEIAIEPLQAQFGQYGEWVALLSRGIDRSLLVPRKTEDPLSECIEFPAPAVSLPIILVTAEILVRRIFESSSRKGRSARAMELTGQVHSGWTWSKQISSKEVIVTAEQAFKLVKYAMENVSLPGPLDNLSITLSDLTVESGRQGALFPEMRRDEDLYESLRQLAANQGGFLPIYKVREVEPWSRIPERRKVLVPFYP